MRVATDTTIEAILNRTSPVLSLSRRLRATRFNPGLTLGLPHTTARQRSRPRWAWEPAWRKRTAACSRSQVQLLAIRAFRSDQWVYDLPDGLEVEPAKSRPL